VQDVLLEDSIFAASVWDWKAACSDLNAQLWGFVVPFSSLEFLFPAKNQEVMAALKDRNNVPDWKYDDPDLRTLLCASNNEYLLLLLLSLTFNLDACGEMPQQHNEHKLGLDLGNVHWLRLQCDDAINNAGLFVCAFVCAVWRWRSRGRVYKRQFDLQSSSWNDYPVVTFKIDFNI
jgi:hypothetical protein